MKLYKLLFISFLCLSCNGQDKINGISFVASPNKITHKHVSPIQKVSANYVALMPFGFIKDLASPTVIHNTNRQWFGETEKGILQYANELEKVGVKLMIKPQIWVWRGEFTGKIKMKSESDWKVLEDSYASFILTYAKTAQQLNAPILCIGTELEQFVLNRPDFWKNLIHKIRKVYKGKLTYAANWDEFKRVPFWKELDYIGIDAYFPLSDKKAPSLEDFELGWQQHKQEIQKVKETINKPVLFTEYGYRSVDFTGKQPWDSQRVEGQVNLENQSKALQAIYNQFWKEDWFAGGFLWKWFVDYEKVGGVKNNRFTPQNKPAEAVIKQNYEN
ncbi:MAG: glycoside hydrolase family 113 [Tenacibaculum sp.]